ncbi:DUF3138 family protein [Amantichitinum ursilacus]|uniref:DUF3138 family protein n=1 Tax=Amantichitinum ursilacus TaxID=857265 RepID=A0A0N0XHK8_9NEIS|nr:DUF3138 family protein [Amantichitinum ursilacus]KPC51972.1 hypothetical protein WG78_14935 [Amantichitinum ursilacus]
MRKKILCTLLAGLTVSGAALAAPKQSDIDALKAQVNALQKQIQQLEAQQAQQAAAPAPAAVPAASASTTPPMSPEDVEAMKQSIAQLQLKVDSLDTTVNEGGLAGLSITGYMDPVYMYNNNAHSGSFSFVNHNGAYNYDGSTFGDVYLDIKKTFGAGSLAPSAEISIMPNRGNGATLLATDDGSNAFMNIINTAVATIPLDTSSSFVIGLMSSFGGYEYQLSTLMPTLTHNLLYDFSDPGSYTGVGYNYSTGNFAWKFMLANEQYRTKGASTQTDTNADTGQAVFHSNSTPTFTTRLDYTWSSSIDLGWSANIGRQTLATGSTCASGFGYQCTSGSPYSKYLFTEADMTYTWADTTINAEIDYGRQDSAAYNGGTAVWYGVSLLGLQKWHSDAGSFGTALRFDYLNDSKNGGGGGGIVLADGGLDGHNGFGISQDCAANSDNAGMDCKGANRSDIAFDLVWYLTDQATLKLEYRHDMASENVFVRNDGTYSKHNDLFGTQFIYAF